jgi:hypothetical protein
MTKVSGNDLILRAKQRAALESASEAFPDSECLQLANASISKWWDLVRLTTWGGQYSRKTQSITLDPNVPFYALADDFAALLSVDVFITTGESPVVASAKPYQEEQRNAFKFWPTIANQRAPVFYQLQTQYDANGNPVRGINFIPNPSPAGQVGVNYVRIAPSLVTGDDEIDTINGWEEWIVCDMAIKMLTKDGQWDAIREIRAQRAEEEDRIKQAAPAADTTMPEITHDVEGNGFPYPWGI